MDREILFRGKRVDNEEWVVGCYVNCYGPNCRLNETRHYIVTYQNEWNEIYTKTVGQYTGLTDRNGKRIWEGDVVMICGSKRQGLPAPVKFIKPECAFVLARIGYNPIWFDPDGDTAYEVIGNIHDNQELLERGREHV